MQRIVLLFSSALLISCVNGQLTPEGRTAIDAAFTASSLACEIADKEQNEPEWLKVTCDVEQTAAPVVKKLIVRVPKAKARLYTPIQAGNSGQPLLTPAKPPTSPQTPANGVPVAGGK